MTPLHTLQSAVSASVSGQAGAARSLAAALAALPAEGSPDERLGRLFGAALLARDAGDDRDSGNLYAAGAGPDEMLAAYDVLAGRTPFIRFGYVAANRALLAASEGADALHVVDVGVGWGGQWLDLLDRLATRAGGPPRVRITGIEIPTPGEDPEAQLRAVGARLTAAAEALGVPFRFEGRATAIEDLGDLGLDPAERLLLNASFALHHVADTGDERSRDAVLARLAALNPALLTLVEPESDHNAAAFPDRVAAAWSHYGAVFDALGALCADAPGPRATIERCFFGREILNVVAGEGAARVERHERRAVWQARLERAGFRPVALDGLAAAVGGELGLSAEAAVTGVDGALALRWRGAAVVNVLAVA